MKKLSVLFLAIVMLLGLSVAAFAATEATLSCTASKTQVCYGVGGEVTFTYSLQNAAVAKSLALTFDIGDQFDVVSAAWSRSDAFMANVDLEKMAAAMAFTSATNINGEVFELKLKAKSAAALGDATVTATPTIKNGAVDIACSPVTATVSVANHTGGTATCVAKAVCTVCGAAYGEINPNNHALTMIPALAATCVTHGHNQYYVCSGCGTCFKDAAATVVTNAEAETITAAGAHKIEAWTITRAATATSTGIKTGTCVRCGESFTVQLAKLASKTIQTADGKGRLAPFAPTLLPGNAEFFNDITDAAALTAAQENQVDKAAQNVRENLETYVGIGQAYQGAAPVCVMDLSLQIHNIGTAGDDFGYEIYPLNGNATVTLTKTAAMKAAANPCLVLVKDDGTCVPILWTDNGDGTISFTVTALGTIVMLDVETTYFAERHFEVLTYKTARAGEEVKLAFCLDQAPLLKSAAISVTYDTAALELLGGKWCITGSEIAQWNTAARQGVIALAENRDVNGAVFELTFKVKDGVEDGSYAVGCTLTAKTKLANGDEAYIEVPVLNGAIEVVNVIPGDVNGDDLVTSDDAIHLLYHTLLPDLYAVNQEVDFNGDGLVTSDDAIYLLYHTLLPDLYPLK